MSRSLPSRNSQWLAIAVAVALIFMLSGLAAGQHVDHQNIPASARQAATMPQVASHLARPASAKSAASLKQRRHSPFDDTLLYDNGPLNGTLDAWTINYGYAVANSFAVTNNPVSEFTFYTWSYPGDTPMTVDWSITDYPFGGSVYGSGTATLANTVILVNGYGYQINLETVSGLDVPLANGTYYLNLQNATTTYGNPLYWDENDGVGCQSPGCPSLADTNTVGTIGSESFEILGGSGTTCASMPGEQPRPQPAIAPAHPSPTQTFTVLYNFTGGLDGAAPLTGLAMDAQGNLYGTASQGGAAGVGTVFKLTHGASGWRFNRIYSFSGADGSTPAGKLVVAPDGTLYGTARGGGSSSSGVLFAMSPSGHILPSVFSNWMQRLLYSFSGGSDGVSPEGDLVFDSGNLYGTTAWGGASRAGMLYEFSNGTMQFLHTFAGAPTDGDGPVSGVIAGQGGLYGATQYGGPSHFGTVYTTAGGYRILYNFQAGSDGGFPMSLASDPAGNLFGTTTVVSPGCGGGGTVFMLSYPDWTLQTLESFSGFGDPYQGWASADASGNLYVTSADWGAYFEGSIVKATCCWNFTSLYDFNGGSDGAWPQGSVLIDAQGNVYGTTYSGGAYGKGVVWEITP